MKRILIILMICTSCMLCAKILPVYVNGAPSTVIMMDTDLSTYMRTQTSAIKAALIVGADSIAVGVTTDEFDKIQLKYKNSEWYVESDSLASPVNIENISFICLYDPRGANPSYSIGTSKYSFQDLRDNADFLGQAEKNGYIIWKYRVRKGIDK